MYGWIVSELDGSDDMLPYIDVLDRAIPMYGLLGVIGFFAALGLILAMSRPLGIDRENAVYLFVFTVIGCMVGAKLLYLLTVLPDLLADLPDMVNDFGLLVRKYLSGGFVFYGGLIGGVSVAFWYCRFFHWRLSDYLPVLVPAVPLMHAFGRLGCFCAGCCYGVEVPWGVTFADAVAGPNGVPLFPVQLVEAVCEFAICAILVRMSVSGASRREPWMLVVAYILMYAPVRFVLEFFRGDAVRGVWFGLSTSQWLSLAACVAVGVCCCCGCAVARLRIYGSWW